MYIRQTLFAVFAGIVAVSPVAASPSEPTRHIVRYSDLNLSNETGRATLDRRIDYAARMVCGSTALATLQDKPDVERCYAAARASAKAQLAEKS